MIDTWLFAAVCFFILAACAILRAIPRASRFDRIVAADAAVTIALSGALVFGVARGSLVIIEFAVIAGLACYCGLFVALRAFRGELA